MILTTSNIESRYAAENWKNQYFENGQWYDSILGSSEEIYGKLLELGETPNPNDVIKILPPDWIMPTCSECHQLSTVGIYFGGNYHPTFLCESCINKAKNLLSETCCCSNPIIDFDV